MHIPWAASIVSQQNQPSRWEIAPSMIQSDAGHVSWRFGQAFGQDLCDRVLGAQGRPGKTQRLGGQAMDDTLT